MARSRVPGDAVSADENHASSPSGGLRGPYIVKRLICVMIGDTQLHVHPGCAVLVTGFERAAPHDQPGMFVYMIVPSGEHSMTFFGSVELLEAFLERA